MAWDAQQQEWARDLVSAVSLVAHFRAEDIVAANALIDDLGAADEPGRLVGRLAELVIYAVESNGGDPDAWIDGMRKHALTLHLRSQE